MTELHEIIRRFTVADTTRIVLTEPYDPERTLELSRGANEAATRIERIPARGGRFSDKDQLREVAGMLRDQAAQVSSGDTSHLSVELPEAAHLRRTISHVTRGIPGVAHELTITGVGFEATALIGARVVTISKDKPGD